jgi:hypothetical protein
MRKLTLSLIVLVVVAGAYAADQTDPGKDKKSGIIGTVHDVTTATTLGDVCINCHSTHAGRNDAPLIWARALPSTTFQTYDSASLSTGVRIGDISKPATLTDPAWGSMLCMSCHDNTNLSNETVTIDGVSTALPGTPGDVPGTAANVDDADFYVVRNVGTIPSPNASGAPGNTTFSTTMLKSDHPVNVKYDSTLNPLLDSTTNAKTDGIKFYAIAAGGDSIQHEFNYTVARTPAAGTGPGTDWGNRTFFIRARLSKGQDLCLACHL